MIAPSEYDVLVWSDDECGEHRVGDRAASSDAEAWGTLGYGDIFGGRIDNIHTVTGAHALGPSRVVIEFDERETFEVWDPQGATISEAEFKIRKAKSSPLGVVLLRPTTHSGEPLLH